MDEFKVGDRVLVPGVVANRANVGHAGKEWYQVDVFDGEGSVYRNLRFPKEGIQLAPEELPTVPGSIVEYGEEVYFRQAENLWRRLGEVDHMAQGFRDSFFEKGSFSVVQDRGANVDG